MTQLIARGKPTCYLRRLRCSSQPLDIPTQSSYHTTQYSPSHPPPTSETFGCSQRLTPAFKLRYLTHRHLTHRPVYSPHPYSTESGKSTCAQRQELTEREGRSTFRVLGRRTAFSPSSGCVFPPVGMTLSNSSTRQKKSECAKLSRRSLPHIATTRRRLLRFLAGSVRRELSAPQMSEPLAEAGAGKVHELADSESGDARVPGKHRRQVPATGVRVRTTWAVSSRRLALWGLVWDGGNVRAPTHSTRWSRPALFCFATMSSLYVVEETCGDEKKPSTALSSRVISRRRHALVSFLVFRALADIASKMRVHICRNHVIGQLQHQNRRPRQACPRALALDDSLCLEVKQSYIQVWVGETKECDCSAMVQTNGDMVGGPYIRPKGLGHRMVTIQRPE